jgi:hypothetical protein
MVVEYLTVVVSQIEPFDNASTELFLQLTVNILSAVAIEKKIYFMYNFYYTTNIIYFKALNEAFS